ncbi:MAG TPA: ATP-binding cassette domain-containing protein [Acidiferrobacteraceae bacterium]|nr:ATP-binding cassette domain-containing protein [Acidiferrobacteraceae bacterium]
MATQRRTKSFETELVIQARGLTKRYGEATVVRGIDFSVPRGQCFGLLGPNGAGKTTTLRMILGVTPRDSGELQIFGVDDPKQAHRVRARIGVVPQLDNLDPDFSVIENLSVYASFFSLHGAKIKERIRQLLEFTELSDRAHTRIDVLSGGMKRRLTIARALINDPELIILDEPTTGLDPQARHMIWSRLRQIRQSGKTLLLTTHYMEEAERLCDDIIIMDNGHIVAQGSPNALVKKHIEAHVVEIRGATESISINFDQFPPCRRQQVGDTLYCYTDDAHPLLAHLESQGELITLQRPANLEDVFLKLTGHEFRD